MEAGIARAREATWESIVMAMDRPHCAGSAIGHDEAVGSASISQSSRSPAFGGRGAAGAARRRHRQRGVSRPTGMRRAVDVWAGIECSLNRVGDRYVDQFARSGAVRSTRRSRAARSPRRPSRSASRSLWERVACVRRRAHGSGWTTVSNVCGGRDHADRRAAAPWKWARRTRA